MPPSDSVRAPRGRGATPRTDETIVCAQPNPVGRRKLRITYRPLSTWSPAEILSARRLAQHYFERVGGFQTADDSVIRLFIDALRRVEREAHLHAAIEAKAYSLQSDDPAERAKKAVFRGTPESFLRRVEYWIDQSPQVQAELRAQEAALHSEFVARQRHADAARRLQQERDRAAADPDGLGDPDAGQPQTWTQFEARINADIAFWGALTAAQRQQALIACEPGWRDICRREGRDPHDGSDGRERMRRDRAIRWARRKWGGGAPTGGEPPSPPPSTPQSNGAAE